ncbi:MBL fold metallo-hydrolase [Oleiagrimonas sp. C23AA]|uniref:MBL fold metallo-hydrolase n=1 Tax=Oleiagrimonas sp. C23AA TaxID=2719047 RepID=UPI00141F3721|nr:MBL fold metallo-hydrolase [Oleiagrimonas sp. C23AA]NII10301.1 MBL fold metallo-hydrolase [Oleiagrimonas sp. C23AA]
MNWQLHVLGSGAAHAAGRLGSSAAVIERDGAPQLLIDCGPDTLDRYQEAYNEPPRALYVTHLHMDHVGGLEGLFYRLWFDPDLRGRCKVFVHADLVPMLQRRVADYPNVLAEGGANFWEAFQLVPCTRGFWLDGVWYGLFATRHHRPGTSFGLVLPGALVWTGDTRPVPEALAEVGEGVACIAHDCGRVGNPSHTGMDDLEREYPADLRQRLLLYHYGDESDAQAMQQAGYRVARAGQRIALASPSWAPHQAG